jgi:N-acetylglucosaminyl-diphospho-decaprenol L-rhamnosyltransferase
MAVDVSVIIVSFNSREHLRACLASVTAGVANLEIEVIVVDNGSVDESAEYVRRSFPDARLITNDQNRGFAAANNQALEFASGRYLLLLNPDAFLLPGALNRLVAFMDARPDIGAVGPMLLNADGTLQRSIGRFPSVLNQVASSLMITRLLPRCATLNEIERRPWVYQEQRAVDWLFGAVLMVRRTAAAQVGPLDDQFFVFCEEKDWCLRLRQAGWGVWYAPEASATHIGREGLRDAETLWLLVLSKLLFVRKHHGPTVGAGAFVVTTLGLVLRAMCYGVLGLLGRRGGLRAGSSRAYAVSLRRLILWPLKRWGQAPPGRTAEEV